MGNKLNRHVTHGGDVEDNVISYRKPKELHETQLKQKKNRNESRRCSRFVGYWLKAGENIVTWSQLFDSPVVVTGVDGQEVFEPGNVRVGVAAGGAEHRGGTGAFHHL